MKPVTVYNFHKTKYGEELLIDVVELRNIKNYLATERIHTLSYYDITLITEGTGFFKIDDRTHRVKPMDIVFSRAGEIREWDTLDIENGYALIFEGEFILSFFNDRHFLDNLSFFNPVTYADVLTLSVEEYELISGLILNVKKEILSHEIKDNNILRALLYQTISELDRIYRKKYSDSLLPIKCLQNRYVRSFMELVEKHFCTEHSVSFYAGKLCITPGYLNEVVKQSLAVNAKKYIQSELIQEAKRLLLYTTMPVAEIAYHLNYENPTYFIRVFRIHTGVTPLSFRQNPIS